MVIHFGWKTFDEMRVNACPSSGILSGHCLNSLQYHGPALVRSSSSDVEPPRLSKTSVSSLLRAGRELPLQRLALGAASAVLS